MIPPWWLEKVLPLLAVIDYAELGRAASVVAGRTSPWDASAIARFKAGTTRTIELANALSEVLGVARPFYTAFSEAEALEMQYASRRHAQPDSISAAQLQRRSKVDEIVRSEIDSARSEVSSYHGPTTPQSDEPGRRGRRTDRDRA